jgi:hypothetical protein
MKSMTPSKKSAQSVARSSTDRMNDHAPTDWALRKADAQYPFDVIVITQTPVESEFDLLFDHGAEPAAKFGEDARIYRLKDNRFAVMSLSPDAMLNAPDGIEFWNWWAKTMQPSFSDLTTAREIGQKIEQLEFLRKEQPAPLH